MLANARLMSIALFLFFASCRNEHKKLFSKLTSEESGITFININNETEEFNILTYEYFYNGGGVALGDINNDGLLDVYFSANTGENKLYLNEGDFHFKDVTENSGAKCNVGWKTGVSFVDVNSDGWLDIYVCRSESDDPELRKNLLYINNRNLTFSEKGNEFGLDDSSYSTQASFFDYDFDGDLDAFILNHSLLRISNSFDISKRNTTLRYPNVGSKLLRNDKGKFVDISDSLGVYGPASNYGLGISISDLNNDGWPDIYSGCDYTGRDKILYNQKGNYFSDVTDSVLSHMSKFTMGTDIADFNGDELMDIVTLDMLPEDNQRQKLLVGADRFNIFNQMVASGLHHQHMRNMLQMNLGNGSFAEIGQLAGVSNTDWSWAPLFADFDNDGNQDLFVTNGFKRDLTNSDFAKYHAFQMIDDARHQGRQISMLNLIDHFKENRIHNYIFKGDGNLAFKNVVVDWGLEMPSLTNGAAYGDLDNDGDLDLVTNNINDIAGIYRNNSAQKRQEHFIQIILRGKAGNVGAIGAKVVVYSGQKKFVRELFPVRGFQSSVDPKIHIGIGTTTKIDSIVVRWPGGEYQRLEDILVDDVKVISYHPSTTKQFAQTPLSAFYVSNINVIKFKHEENEFIDFNVQPLLPRKYSTMGPALAKGDVNHDGLEDIFVGGARGQTSSLFLQLKNHSFFKSPQLDFAIDKESEDVDAIFFDADDDGDQDLYVVTGGYEFATDDKYLQDRFYVNNGDGQFKKAILPEMTISGSCVRASDVDRDGDLDLFIGGRIIPGRYPECPTSVLLLNDGKGSYSIARVSNDLRNAGMVTDVLWIDLNNDHYDDLILVGEWMNIEVFINDHGTLRKRTKEFIGEQNSGWWNCIAKADFDNDGDHDLIIGNVGSNNLFKASDTTPVSLYFDDFDRNGSVDPILNYHIKGENFPYPMGEELVDQVPIFKKRFPNNTSYSNAKLENVLTPFEISGAQKLTAKQFQTVYFENNNTKFELKTLPPELQIAPVFSIEVCDVNKDGFKDFIAMGNLSGTRSRTGKLTGNSGFIFLGDGHGDFKFVPPLKTGLRCVGDVRKVISIGDRIFIANSNDSLQVYDLK